MASKAPFPRPASLGLLCLGAMGFSGCRAADASSTQPNIVVISVDGLRLDRTGFGGGPHPSTPNLDALVADSIWFPKGFSQSNESLLSHASLFTGRHPLEVSVPDYLRYVLGPEQLTFPEVLKQVGYDTGASLASGHVGAEFGFNQGFDMFYEADRWGSFQDTVPVALSWLESRKGTDTPFALFLHGYDCHRPYLEPGPFYHPFDADAADDPVHDLLGSFNKTERIIDGVYYPDLRLDRIWHSTGSRILDPHAYSRDRALGMDNGQPLSPRSLDHMKAHYDSGVLLADTFLGMFFEGLDVLGEWDNTVIIVVSDHGEDLQDHGFTNHRAVVQDTTTRVPWIVGGGAIPASARGSTHDALADAVDLMPTLTDIAGTVAPANTRGRSLWPAVQGARPQPKPIVFQTGVVGQVSARTPTHRLVFGGTPLDHPLYAERLRDTPLSDPAFALYDTATDPLETNDVKAREAELAEGLRQKLLAWYVGQDRSETSQTLTEAQKKALQDGGYW